MRYYMNGLDLMIENTVKWSKSHLDSEKYIMKCLSFVEDALEISNGIEIYGGDTAKESADLYANSINTGEPPRGSFVFYDCKGEIDGKFDNWGHVGFCIGDGKIIHSWGHIRIDNFLSAENLERSDTWHSPSYIGWVPLDRVLIGYRKKEICV